MSFDYDLFVIGGGSGGVRAARIAAGTHGAKVALAEEYRMGGTCVIRGCVPKKLMVFASEYPDMVADARSYGWDARIGGFDWSAFRAKLDAELTRLEKAYRCGLSGAGVTVFDSRAVLVDAHTVKLADGTQVSAKYILVATGGAPFIPDVPGRELAITSNEIFQMDALPSRVLVVGGGYIASEFACILNGLGCEVAQYYRGAQILRGFDDEARGHVAEAMRENGVGIHCGTDVMRLEKVADGIRAVATDGSERVFDAVLYATGRKPNSSGLGLEALGVALGRNGQIEVDEYSQTAVPSIFAVGDVTDRINLTPVAIREGHAFADTIFGGQRRKVDHSLFASAVFTQPEMGTIGLTEEEAREREPIEVYATAFRPMQSAFAGRPDRVLMKLIVSQASRKILGCHIVAPGAGEMIQLVGIAVTMGATKEQFDATIAVHPTMAEELVTMRSPTRRG
ncbi:glutathione-disulfide reductase [Pseudorhodobacter sp. E13]|uniref:glutathione-disulfide reductase n=1 Tax=Pseudorhodobacter sp. E13 TaxID=2487931 RepID=UPI000F8D03A8|nr:glutathione-disulfide reductase [Pseudorhodobacter sp. E13]RUS63267.1 glutathione-disulfide reductase [Pseudorhodobacter sp. E13]